MSDTIEIKVPIDVELYSKYENNLIEPFEIDEKSVRITEIPKDVRNKIMRSYVKVRNAAVCAHQDILSILAIDRGNFVAKFERGQPTILTLVVNALDAIQAIQAHASILLVCTSDNVEAVNKAFLNSEITSLNEDDSKKPVAANTNE